MNGGVSDVFAELRNAVMAPSSSVTRRARFSTTIASISAEPGAPTSVGVRSGVSPKARPTSPEELVGKVLLTV